MQMPDGFAAEEQAFAAELWAHACAAAEEATGTPLPEEPSLDELAAHCLSLFEPPWEQGSGGASAECAQCREPCGGPAGRLIRLLMVAQARDTSGWRSWLSWAVRCCCSRVREGLSGHP